MDHQVEVYDTTLRDGTQRIDVNLSARDKVRFARALDEFGVDYVELGYPGSNQNDQEAFELMRRERLSHAVIAAFGSTRRKGVKAGKDSNLLAIVSSGAEVGTIFGKSWIEHVRLQLAMTPQQNLDAVYESVAFLQGSGLRVFYDAEHFFDGFRDSQVYALSCLEAAVQAGAERLVLCDTNGGFFPHQILEAVKIVKDHLRERGYAVPLGIHCHNDRELAVANSLVAVTDIVQIQGVINGFGERSGNANLSSVLPNLKDLGVRTNVEPNLQSLKEISDLLYMLTNIRPDNYQPFVGHNAFATKAGVHADALLKGATYEFIDPRSVGNKRRIVLSDLSGKANVLDAARRFGYVVEKDDPRVGALLGELKEMEARGYDVGTIEAEEFLLLHRYFGDGREFFTIDDYSVTSGPQESRCRLEGRVNGSRPVVEKTVAGGPVNVLYQALQEMLDKKYASINGVSLADFKVRTGDDRGPASTVRVYCEFAYGKNGGVRTWATVGVSDNIIDASLQAVQKGFHYHLLKSES